MSHRKSILPDRSPEDLEAVMRRASLWVSLVSLGLMLGGLSWFGARHGLTPLPGGSVTPLAGFIHPEAVPWPLLAMSAGVVLLGLLPGLRVALALGIYLRRRQVLDITASLIVLIELLLSLAALAR